MSVLEKCIEIAPFFREALGDKFSIAISDLDSYIFHSPGEVEPGIKIGDKLKEGTIMQEVIKKKGKISKKVDREKSAFSLPYIISCVPLKEDDEVKCVLALVQSVDTQEKIDVMSEKISETSKLLLEVYDNLNSGAEELASSAQNISLESEEINAQIQKTDNIIKLVDKISDSTHMLGLNAAIEAARAGEWGRGFSVVAEEIRKLASETKESSAVIAENLKKMQDSMSELATEIERIASMSEEQAASSQETNASIKHLQKVADELKTISKKL